jgi:hypothetical protein
MMEKAVGSKGSKEAFNRANASIKVAQAIKEGKR